jgi:hypothetical protein
MTQCSVVVGYQRFGGSCCLRLQVEVLWVVTPYSVVVGYQRFRGPCCLHFHTEDGASMILRNIRILQRYTASQRKVYFT